MIARRTFIKGLRLAAIAATTSGLRSRKATPSRCRTPPAPSPAKVKAPPGACDCHHHIYDVARFPRPRRRARSIPNARVEEFRLLQKRIGTTRSIIVHAVGPTLADNRVTLDAIAQLSGECARRRRRPSDRSRRPS